MVQVADVDAFGFLVLGVPPGEHTPTFRALPCGLDGPPPGKTVEIVTSAVGHLRTAVVYCGGDEIRTEPIATAYARTEVEALRILDAGLADLERVARHARRLVAARLEGTTP